MCGKNPTGWQLQEHLQSKDHKRHMLNKQWADNPLAYVPNPHRQVTKIVKGWPVCTICKKRMDDSHMMSPKHMQWLNSFLSQQGAGAVDNAHAAEPILQPCVDHPSAATARTAEPLRQPPPPPEPPSNGCGVAVESIANPASSFLPVASAQSFIPQASVAQTHGTANNDILIAATDVPRPVIHNYMIHAAAGSHRPLAHSCETLASQVMQPPLAQVASTQSALLHAPAPQRDQSCHWSSSCSPKFLKEDDQNQPLQEFFDV